jgi:hypothetical protein
MGGAPFIRRPQIQLTILGRALRPHFRSIIEAIDNTPQIAATFVAKSRRRSGRVPLSTPQQPDPAGSRPGTSTGSWSQSARKDDSRMSTSSSRKPRPPASRACPRGIKAARPRNPSQLSAPRGLSFTNPHHSVMSLRGPSRPFLKNLCPQCTEANTLEPTRVTPKRSSEVSQKQQHYPTVLVEPHVCAQRVAAIEKSAGGCWRAGAADTAKMRQLRQ